MNVERWLELASAALLLLACFVLADIAARGILRLAARWEPLRRAVRWATAEEEPNHRGLPTFDGEHRAVARLITGGVWVAACECSWTGDIYEARIFGDPEARTYALMEAEEHVLRQESA